MKWFDGSSTATSIRVLPFSGHPNSITIDVLAGYDTWLDFTYIGPETGAFSTPYNTFAEGRDNVAWGGLLHIKAGQTNATVTDLGKPMTLQAFGGIVTIGHLP